MKNFVLAALVVAVSVVSASAKSYVIDGAHSSVSFSIRHMGVSKVHGGFGKVSGTIDYEAGKAKTWKTEVEIDPASVDTRNSKRDDHLRTADFFDVAKCPKMTFKSTKVEGAGAGGKLHGELTMHCVTKPVVLDLVEVNEGKDPKGNSVFGASATGKVKRTDFGVGAANPMLGDEVTISLDVEAKPKP
jgi:polyisoprenoid-binding protein YceI